MDGKTCLPILKGVCGIKANLEQVLVKSPRKIYHGEIKCESCYGNGKSCRNNAYFEYSGQYLCGVHSKKYENTRVALPLNPNKNQIKRDEQVKRDELVQRAATKNQIACKPGAVTLSKLKMMAGAPHIDGYQSVMPNFKHGNRKDAVGLSGLSPKSLGPVNHVMPNLPPSANLENYHQHAKFWPFELDGSGSPTQEAFMARIKAYKSTSPDRHKHNKDIIKKYNNGNINIPKYSIYYDKSGNERRYSYVECRYFYCHYYELLAGVHPEFQQLRELRNNGTNLNIIGYDSYPPIADAMKMYTDTSKPFGHEMVLYCMLVLDDSSEFPWNQYREMYSNIYMDMF